MNLRVETSPCWNIVIWSSGALGNSFRFESPCLDATDKILRFPINFLVPHELFPNRLLDTNFSRETTQNCAYLLDRIYDKEIPWTWGGESQLPSPNCQLLPTPN